MKTTITKKAIITIMLCGTTFSCTHENLPLEQTENYELYTNTRSVSTETDTYNTIAQIIEDKLSEYHEDYYKIYWGTVVIMDVESGYARTINCDADDDKIGQAISNYAEEPIYQGTAFLPFPFMALLDEGGMQPSDAVDIDYPRKKIDGILITDPHELGATTFGEAFIQGSNIAIAQECYDKLNISGSNLYRAMGYDKMLSPLKMLRAYNTIANKGKLINTKFDVNEPIEVMDESYFSEQATEECKRCMVKYALNRELEGIAVYSGTAQQPDETGGFSNSTYVMTHAGFFPIDNPKYSILVSFHTKHPMPFLGNQVLPAIIEEINKEE